MRILGSTKNELEIFDAPSNTTITYYWRNPTPVEKVKYSNEVYTRGKNKDGKDIIKYHPDVRLQFVLDVLLGFKDGDFGDKDGNPISSDKTKPNYKADWKELIQQHAPEHLGLIATHVFDSTKIKTSRTGEAIEIEIEETEGDERPFTKS